jgi:hypothetical protein
MPPFHPSSTLKLPFNFFTASPTSTTSTEALTLSHNICNLIYDAPGSLAHCKQHRPIFIVPSAQILNMGPFNKLKGSNKSNKSNQNPTKPTPSAATPSAQPLCPPSATTLVNPPNTSLYTLLTGRVYTSQEIIDAIRSGETPNFDPLRNEIDEYEAKKAEALAKFLQALCARFNHKFGVKTDDHFKDEEPIMFESLKCTQKIDEGDVCGGQCVNLPLLRLEVREIMALNRIINKLETDSNVYRTFLFLTAKAAADKDKEERRATPFWRR